jgi:hypothetical protein
LIELAVLLPLYYNNPAAGKKRKKVEGRKYRLTCDEIYDKFGGCAIDKF